MTRAPRWGSPRPLIPADRRNSLCPSQRARVVPHESMTSPRCLTKAARIWEADHHMLFFTWSKNSSWVSGPSFFTHVVRVRYLPEVVQAPATRTSSTNVVRQSPARQRSSLIDRARAECPQQVGVPWPPSGINQPAPACVCGDAPRRAPLDARSARCSGGEPSSLL